MILGARMPAQAQQPDVLGEEHQEARVLVRGVQEASHERSVRAAERAAPVPAEAKLHLRGR